MAHSIPKELKGEERILSIPILNIHFNKKGIIYNGLVSVISVVIGKLTNIWTFLVLFILLNIIAYPLAHSKIPKNIFEGGNVGLDKYFFRKQKYKKYRKIVYLRKRGK